MPALHELRKLTAMVGRHRRPDPPAQVTLVLRDGQQIDVPPESALARSMGQVAGLLAHW